MKCPKCGTIQPNTDKICDVCGAPLESPEVPPAVADWGKEDPLKAAQKAGGTSTRIPLHSTGSAGERPAAAPAGTLSDAPARPAEETASPSAKTASPGTAPPALSGSADAGHPAAGGAPAQAAASRAAPAPDAAQDAEGRCDECGKVFPKQDLQLARGKKICPHCRSKISDTILKKVASERPVGNAVKTAGTARQAPESAAPKKPLPGRLGALVKWPEVTLDADQQAFREEWKRSNGMLAASPPLPEKKFRFTGNFQAAALACGAALLGSAAAVHFLFPGKAVATLAWLLLGLGGLVMIFTGVDARGGLKVDRRGLWKEAPLTGKRVFWPSMETVELTYKALPGLGAIYAALNIEVRTKEKKVSVFTIPCLFGTPCIEGLTELKKLVAAGALVFGAGLK